MSKVWYSIPSALPPHQAMACLSKWREKGYRVAVFRNAGAESLPTDLCMHGEYPGYGVAVNILAASVLRYDPECDWVVCAGDDVFPDPDHTPDDIAAQCTAHFSGTLGIMQPCSDRYGIDAAGTCAAERVCVSPWLGREWCERGYMGQGPLWGEFRHNFIDEDLKNVADMLGVLWQRQDLSQFHDNWSRKGEALPEHLKWTAATWDTGKALFNSRKAAGFPNSGILPAWP